MWKYFDSSVFSRNVSVLVRVKLFALSHTLIVALLLSFSCVHANDTRRPLVSGESRNIEFTDKGSGTSPFAEVFESLAEKHETFESRAPAAYRGGAVKIGRSSALLNEPQTEIRQYVSEPPVRSSFQPIPVAEYPEKFAILGSVEASALNKSRAINGIRKGHASASEIAALHSFVEMPAPGTHGTEDLNVLSVKNDALVCLLEMRPIPDGLGQSMISIVLDETEGPVWREYVLQYFGMYYRAKWPPDSTTQGGGRIVSDPERIAMQQALAAAIFQKESGLSGTALIVIDELAKDYPEFQGSALARGARFLAKANKTCPASRVTAVSMLAENPTTEDLEIAGQLASDRSEALAVRVAATGCLARWSQSELAAEEKLKSLAMRPDSDRAGQHLARIAEIRLEQNRKQTVDDEPDLRAK